MGHFKKKIFCSLSIVDFSCLQETKQKLPILQFLEHRPSLIYVMTYDPLIGQKLKINFTQSSVITKKRLQFDKKNPEIFPLFS